MTDHIESLNIPYHKILEETRLKIAVAREYLAQLQVFGLTKQWLSDLEEKANQAEQVISNRQQLETLKSLTATKNQALEDCYLWGTQLRLRMELVFKNEPTQGMKFPCKEFTQSRRSSPKMISLMSSLITMAKQHQQALKTAGQTPKVIKEGITLLNKLEQAYEAQEQHKFSRSTLTLERRQRYKELYDAVNQINKIGQTVFIDNPVIGLQFRSNWGQIRKQHQNPK